MKIELSASEMKVIENLCMDASLAATSYAAQGRFRVLKDHLCKCISDYERCEQIRREH